MQLNQFFYLLVFLPIIAGAVMLSRRFGRAHLIPSILLAASLGFYLSNETWGAVVLLASCVINWGIVYLLTHPREERVRLRLLWVGLGANVLVLVAFKGGLTALSNLLTLRGFDVGLPLGLSFFTLTQVMLLVDAYEGLVPSRSLSSHMLFVAFFPNITAGPILRSRLFFSQLEQLRSDGVAPRYGSAALLIAIGTVKKLVFGDTFAKVSSIGYANLGQLTVLDAWITVLAAAFEIYFDFSGYSDVALGSAQLFGLRLSRNFNVPFRASNISDFWRRWHISLSDFITTYLYTPLLKRMGRPTLRKSALASTVAMLVAGAWHGLTANFLLFGLLHGLALGGYQYWKRLKRPMPSPFDVVLTFAFVCVVFVTVKAPTLAATGEMLQHLLWGAAHSPPFSIWAAIPRSECGVVVAACVLGASLAFWGRSSEEWANQMPPSLRRDLLVASLLVVAYTVASSGTSTDFRYRQF